MANGTGDGTTPGKVSSSGTVGGATVIGGGVGASVAAYINYYGDIPPILHSDTIVLSVAALAALSGVITHLWTRVDKDHDNIPDVLQRGIHETDQA